MISTRVFDQRVDCLTLNKIYAFILNSVIKDKKSLIFALNIHILVELNKDQRFKKQHEKRASVIFADGVPIVWFSKFNKNKLPQRVSGTDLVEKILNNKNLKVFLLGSSHEVLKNIQSNYKCVCGVYAPPYNNTWLKEEKNKIIKKINKSQAQVLLVAVGPLKQERWLVDNFKDTNAKVGLGIGSALDILANKTPRAPKLVQTAGFEWVWRIALEPKRLFQRYVFDLVYLIRILPIFSLLLLIGLIIVVVLIIMFLYT
jgi:N-acetylglucosaminyldiphosphoundecaprenol N-acetyl-beta-D-mannosaminyltransferase